MVSIYRKLIKQNGLPRKAVRVILWNDTRNIKAGDAVTDGVGRFSIETAPIGTERFHLEYYGDSIKKTIFNNVGVKVSEDPITPWEYFISLTEEGGGFDTDPPDGSTGFVTQE